MIEKLTGPKFFLPKSGSFSDSIFVSDGLVADTAEEFKHKDVVAGFAYPAFVDGHAHPLFAGREARGPNVNACKTIYEVQEVLAEYKVKNPSLTWIEGGAYDRNLVEGGRFLATWIDEVVSDVPVVLHAADHHTIWVNTKALELLPKQLPALFAGSIDVDEEGKPSGVLREPEAMGLILNLAPAKTIDEEIEALVWSDSQLIQNGIVLAQDAWITEGMTEVYLEAIERGALKCDYNLAFKIEPQVWRSALQFANEERNKVLEIGSTKMSAKTTKFFVDGVFGSATAAVSESYLDPLNSFGEPLWDQEELKLACLEVSKLGFQLHIHAIGDAGVKQALDAIEFVQAELGSPELPSVIAHLELVDETDFERFAKLGVIANMQPLWAKQDGMLQSCVPRLGKERLDRLYRMRDLLNAKATIGFGSDWPVSSVNPLEGIATAVSRTNFEANEPCPWTPEQAMTPIEALKAYTEVSRFQLEGLNQIPLTKGSSADFVVLDRDLTTCTAREIFHAKVLATYKDGKEIYRAS